MSGGFPQTVEVLLNNEGSFKSVYVKMYQTVDAALRPFCGSGDFWLWFQGRPVGQKRPVDLLWLPEEGPYEVTVSERVRGGGGPSQPVKVRAAALLASHGVPKDQADSRTSALLSAVGGANSLKEIAQLDDVSAWSSLKRKADELDETSGATFDSKTRKKFGKTAQKLLTGANSSRQDIA